MIPIINSLTSLLGGFAIFPMLGYLSNETGQPIEDLDLSGFGITFVAYTQGLATFPNGWAQFCSVVFFLMICTLGIDTQIGVTEAVITFVKETPWGARLPGPAVTVVTCAVGWLLSLPCTTNAGYYWVTLLWDYGNYMSMFIVAALSLVGSSWIAGTQWHHKASLALRGKAKENPVLLFMWRFWCPLVCLVLFALACVGLSPYPQALGAHGEGTGIFPVGFQVFSCLINFGPAFIAAVALAIPPAWLWWMWAARSGAPAAQGEVALQAVRSDSGSSADVK